MSDLGRLKRHGSGRKMFRGERLDRLRFQDAFDDCIALSELAMDMVEAFSSRLRYLASMEMHSPNWKDDGHAAALLAGAIENE